MKTLFLILLMVIASFQSVAQIDFEKMRKQYEKRFAFLDTMVADPSDFGLKYDKVLTKASDSVSIAGWFIPVKKSKHTLLMVHGFMMNKSNMLSRAKFYHDMGFSILMMDLRARGESTGKATGGMGEGNVPDVLSMAAYYKDNYKEYGSLLGYGFSHGGRALIHAAEVVPFDRLLLESTPYDLANALMRQMRLAEKPDIQQEDLNKALSSIAKIPILLMLGDSDTAINESEGNLLLSQNTNKKSKMVVFNKTEHDVVIDKNEELVKETLIGWLRLKKVK
jgi:esterase/lipase